VESRNGTLVVRSSEGIVREEIVNSKVLADNIKALTP